MMIGVKIWKPGHDLDEIAERGRPDFIETMALRGEDYSGLKEYGLPVTIHCEHSMLGPNPADPGLRKVTRESVDFAMKTADMLDSDVIVIHPGNIQGKSCSLEHSLEFLRGLEDRRLHLENMPYICSRKHRYKNLGRSVEEMRNLLKETGMKFCLDFGHATASAFGYGVPHMEMIREMMSLKPCYFHLSDTRTDVELDDHAHIGDGRLDLGAIKAMLPKDAMVTLETPVDVEGRTRDIRIMRQRSP
ncbi:MAG: hypothetical protein DRO99_00010 [Candidatus Aenigmatarchaeota archaeon]|nr:MAG: hypothetical protein DRO99_00010 [Candidatus Aenigmarchaeota archaeon]